MSADIHHPTDSVRRRTSAGAPFPHPPEEAHAMSPAPTRHPDITARLIESAAESVSRS